MLLEIEKGKANRRLEKSTKQLSDARWKKKKQAHQQDIDSGLSLATSEISENKILHCKEKEIYSQIHDIYQTPLHQLVKEKTVDSVEISKPIKTVPLFLQDKFFHQPKSFDKYTKNYYEKQITSSLDSWKHTEGTLLAGNIDTVAVLHPYDPSSQRLLRRRQLESMEDSLFGDSPGGSRSRTNRVGGGSRRTSGGGGGSPKSTMNLSASLSSLGGINSLSQNSTMSSLLSASKEKVSRSKSPVHNHRIPPKQSSKTKSLTILDSVNSLIQYSEEKILDDVSMKSAASRASSASASAILQQLLQSTPATPATSQLPRKKKHPHDLKSTVSTFAIVSDRKIAKSYLQPLGERTYEISREATGYTGSIDSDKLNNFLDTLQEDGIYLGENGIPLQNQGFYHGNADFFLSLFCLSLFFR
jgi:hypothetical protein